MSPEWITYLETLGSLLQAAVSCVSIFIAIVALVFSFRVERRSGKRFQTEMELQERIARANLRPILTIATREYEDNRAVFLKNVGGGTAVITNVTFTRGDHKTSFLAELFDLTNLKYWDTFYNFTQNRYYLMAGSEFCLVQLTLETLDEQGFVEEDALQAMNTLKEQISQVTARITYEDILGNPKEDCEWKG